MNKSKLINTILPLWKNFIVLLKSVFNQDDVKMMCYCDITILKIHGFDFCCIIIGISKSEVINIMQNIDLSKKMEH